MNEQLESFEQTRSLDPEDWTALRTLGHAMLDDMFDHIETLRPAQSGNLCHTLNVQNCANHSRTHLPM